MGHNCKCVICRHYDYDEDKSKEYESSSIFSESGREVVINLCLVHSIELFKKGQRKFLTGHYKILVDLIDSNDASFIEVLEETVKRNKDSIY